MHTEQRQRAHELLREHGIQQALFAKFESVKWLTGFAPPVQVGPHLFVGGPSMVWYEDGQFTLIVIDGYASLAAPFAQEPDGRVATYLGYTIEQPIAGSKHLVTKFAELISASRSYSGNIGIERDSVTELIATTLEEGRFGSTKFVPVDGWLEPLRMVKTAEEITKLRENFALTDIGHAAARQAVKPGMREIDVWNEVHSAIQKAAGCRVPLGNDLVVGYRQDNIGGWPLDYEIRAQDSVIVDLSTILHGYWSDSCATYYAGERTARQEKIHKVITDALEYGISLIRPGAVAKDIDQKMRQFIANAGYSVYPHHTGHGVGVSGHEAPRLVPYNDEVLQENMVIMLEPGIYFPGEIGVRLEDAVLVTKDGAEVLTHHDKR